MLRYITTLCILAGSLLIPQARAACSTSTPLDALAGVWTFNTEGFNFPPTQFLASAGRFVATPGVTKGPNVLPIGYLAVAQTASVDGSPTRLSIDAFSPPATLGNSRYQVNDDCTAGSLLLNTPGRADQLDFYFITPDEIVFTGSNNADIVNGSAKRVSAGLVSPACPANPLSTLVGTWTFSVDGFRFPPTLFLSTVGRFTASIGADTAGNPIGVMAIVQTAAISGSPSRLETDPGRFALNGNCSGGNLTFNTGSGPRQYDFWFNSPDTITIVGSNNGDIVEGFARRATQ